MESTFSMPKAKFGDHLRSKTDTALGNEALCKVIYHNICCLIQSHYELEVNPVFRADDEPERAESEPASSMIVADEFIDALAWV